MKSTVKQISPLSSLRGYSVAQAKQAFCSLLDCFGLYAPSQRRVEIILIAIIYTLFILGGFLTTVQAVPETQKYEDYLNNLKTLSGEFTQLNSKGQKASGTIQISRPGKMRLDYNPPSSLLIVSDGKWLITYDKEAQETNYVSLDNTPAAFILRPQIRFSGDVAITGIVPKGDTTEISLIRKEEPDAGYLSLVFTEDPVSLKEWSVVDAQGIETRVNLSKLESNISLPPELFMIKSPNLIQQIF